MKRPPTKHKMHAQLLLVHVRTFEVIQWFKTRETFIAGTCSLRPDKETPYSIEDCSKECVRGPWSLSHGQLDRPCSEPTSWTLTTMNQLIKPIRVYIAWTIQENTLLNHAQIQEIFPGIQRAFFVCRAWGIQR